MPKSNFKLLDTPFNGSSYPLEQIAQPLERFHHPLGKTN